MGESVHPGAQMQTLPVPCQVGGDKTEDVACELVRVHMLCPPIVRHRCILVGTGRHDTGTVNAYGGSRAVVPGCQTVDQCTSETGQQA